jgi:streptogramin lyase
VARYDPERWAWIDLGDPYAEWTDHYVQVLDCALDHRLVVGYEDQGVDIFDLDEVIGYHYGSAGGETETLRSLAAAPASTPVWVIGEESLALISDGGLNPMDDLSGGVYYQAGLDSANNFCAAAFDRVIRRTPDGTWTLWDNRQVADLFNTWVTGLALAADETVWLGSHNQIARFDPRSGAVVELYMEEPGMVPGAAGRVAVDPYYDWVAYGVRGVGASVLKDGEWLPYILDDALIGNHIRTLTQDSDGYLWFGDRSGQLTYADPANLASPRGSFELPRGFALSIYADPQGGLWVGHFDGASFYSAQHELHLVALAPQIADAYVRAITRDAGGRLWVGADEGLFVWDGARLTTVSLGAGLTDASVRALQPDGEAMWVGTTEGLARITGATMEVFNTQNSALPSDYIGALAVDPWGGLWSLPDRRC